MSDSKTPTNAELEHLFDELIDRFELDDSGPPIENYKMPDGTYWEYDDDLQATIEVSPDGKRYIVKYQKGKGLVRIKDLSASGIGNASIRQGEAAGANNPRRSEWLWEERVLQLSLGKWRLPFVNPDIIAKQLSTALKASQVADDQRKSLLASGASFVTEGIRPDPKLLKDARSRGYFTRVLFVCVKSPDVNVARVTIPVTQGGRSVPESAIIALATTTP